MTTMGIPAEDAAPPASLGRGGSPSPEARNTVFIYLCGGPSGARQLRRVVVRGVCTRVHEERIQRALVRSRFFAAAAVLDPADGWAAATSQMTCCELVSIAPAIGPAGKRTVEDMVAQLEAIAMSGWTLQPPA